MNNETMDQLMGYLENPEPKVRSLALDYIVGYTSPDVVRPAFFKANTMAAIKALMKASNGHQATHAKAVTALINLSDDLEIREYLASDPDYLQSLCEGINVVDPQARQLSCMLLSNLAHQEQSRSLVGPGVQTLLSIFCQDNTGSCDYLAFVFSELARIPEGQKWWTSNELPLTRLFPDISSSSSIRKAGVLATIKNSLFQVQCHERVGNSKLIEHLMLALKGPETLDEEDTQQLPELVRQSMGPEKQREQDSESLLMIVESLLLLCGSKEGRSALRSCNAYFMIREVHLAVENDAIRDTCERFVNMIMRGEPEEKALIQEVA